MAENKRTSKNFFSKCVAASGARIELDVEAHRASWLWGLLLMDIKLIIN